MVPGMRRRGRPSSFPSPPPATPAGSAPDRSYVYACRGTRTMPSSSPSLTASFALLCALLAASEAAAADNVFTRAVNRAAPRPLTFYGNALSVYGQCEGDCDSDEDCYAGMVCYQRNGYAQVPGCTMGGVADIPNVDYCVRAEEVMGAQDTGAEGGVWGGALPLLNTAGNPVEGERLRECEGDCDSDWQCSGSLVCLQRDQADGTDKLPVPSCRGAPIDGWDYCVDLARIGWDIPEEQEQQEDEGDGVWVDPPTIKGPTGGTAAPWDFLITPPPTAAPTVTDLIVPGTVAYLGREPEGVLDRCQGDCDRDKDCLGGLICFRREVDSPTTIPGCLGEAFVGGEDYCADPADLPTDAPTMSAAPTLSPATLAPTRGPTHSPTRGPTRKPDDVEDAAASGEYGIARWVPLPPFIISLAFKIEDGRRRNLRRLEDEGRSLLQDVAPRIEIEPLELAVEDLLYPVLDSLSDGGTECRDIDLRLSLRDELRAPSLGRVYIRFDATGRVAYGASEPQDASAPRIPTEVEVGDAAGATLVDGGGEVLVKKLQRLGRGFYISSIKQAWIDVGVGGGAEGGNANGGVTSASGTTDNTKAKRTTKIEVLVISVLVSGVLGVIAFGLILFSKKRKARMDAFRNSSIESSFQGSPSRRTKGSDKRTPKHKVNTSATPPTTGRGRADRWSVFDTASPPTTNRGRDERSEKASPVPVGRRKLFDEDVQARNDELIRQRWMQHKKNERSLNSSYGDSAQGSDADWTMDMVGVPDTYPPLGPTPASDRKPRLNVQRSGSSLDSDDNLSFGETAMGESVVMGPNGGVRLDAVLRFDDDPGDGVSELDGGSFTRSSFKKERMLL